MAKALTVKIGADTTQFSKGMDRMQKKTKSTASSIKGTMARVLGAGLLLNGLRSFTQELDRAGKMAQRFGTDAVTIQKLGVVAELNGTSFERMGKALTDANRAAEEAAGGMARQSEAFEAMGINANEFIGMGLKEQLTALSDGFILADKSGQGFSSAQIIMGGSAKELIPTLRQGTEAINEQAAAASAASNSVVDSVQEMNDSWTRAKNTMLGFAASAFEVLTKIGPILKRVGDQIKSNITTQLDLVLISMGHIGAAIIKMLKGDFSGAKDSIVKVGTSAAKTIQRTKARWDADNAKMAKALISEEVAEKTKGLKKVAKIAEDLEKKGLETRRRIYLKRRAAAAAAEAKEEEDARAKVATTTTKRVTGSSKRGQEISSLATMGGGRGFVGGMTSLTKAALQGNKILTNIHNELKKPQGGLA
jgi:hypothetical protein